MLIIEIYKKAAENMQVCHKNASQFDEGVIKSIRTQNPGVPSSLIPCFSNQAWISALD